MGPFVLSRVAGRALARHKMRTCLAALGIIIGVGAVICAVAIGEGAAVRIEQAISAIGVNFIWVEAGSVNVAGVRTGGYGTRTLVEEDAIAIQKGVPLIVFVSPQVDTGAQVVRGNQNWRTTLRGESADYFTIRDWRPIKGALFTDQDVLATANACVLGKSVADILFGDEDSIDHQGLSPRRWSGRFRSRRARSRSLLESRRSLACSSASIPRRRRLGSIQSALCSSSDARGRR